MQLPQQLGVVGVLVVACGNWMKGMDFVEMFRAVDGAPQFGFARDLLKPLRADDQSRSPWSRFPTRCASPG